MQSSLSLAFGLVLPLERERVITNRVVLGLLKSVFFLSDIIIFFSGDQNKKYPFTYFPWYFSCQYHFKHSDTGLKQANQD